MYQTLYQTFEVFFSGLVIFFFGIAKKNFFDSFRFYVEIWTGTPQGTLAAKHADRICLYSNLRLEICRTMFRYANRLGARVTFRFEPSRLLKVTQDGGLASPE